MKYLIYFTWLFASLQGEIIETHTFKECLNYIDNNTLFIFDIDDTLLLPVQTLGTDVWFLHRLNEYRSNFDSLTAKEKAIADWEGIRHLTQVKIVEEGSDQIVEEIQSKCIVMGLSTQGLSLATRTIQQLQSLNIDLSKSSPSPEDHYFINQIGNLYRKGILFTSGTPKGISLTKLFDIINYHPQKIVFINDKETHLKDVEKSIAHLGIPFIGLRYTFSDKRIAAFNPALADIQWYNSNFGHILTDDEAAFLLLDR